MPLGRHRKILIHNASILTMGQAISDLPNGDILIVDNRIADI
jgi:hypothetical protein